MPRRPKQYGTKTKTVGTPCIIDDHKLVAGKPGRCEIEEGYALHSGTVRFADGTEHNAFFFIDEESAGELSGMMVLTLSDGLIEQRTPNFSEVLKRTDGQIFPYKYRILGEPTFHDIHTDAQY